jgi:hypothetical protein
MIVDNEALSYCLAPQFSLDNMWITISSGILGFSFIFGNSIRTVFESCLTLFVVHPFDVGDTIFIEGGYHVVEEASLNKVIINRLLEGLFQALSTGGTHPQNIVSL